MSETNGLKKDESIQDALNNERQMPSNVSDSGNEPKQNGNHSVNDRVECGDNTSIDKKEAEKSPENTQTNGDKSNEDVNLDLANPDSVLHMLETVDLTEEDTEGLLQEAYNMNRKLKEMLRRQEKEDAASGQPTQKSKPKPKTKPKRTPDSSTSSTNSSGSGSGSRIGSSFGSRKILPPISGEKETSVYAIKLKRSRTNIVDTRPPVSEAPPPPRSKSSKVSFRLLIELKISDKTYCCLSAC